MNRQQRPQRPSPLPSGWKQSLAQILGRSNRFDATGHKVVGSETQRARREHLYRALHDIRDLGFKLQKVENLQHKHIVALAEHYAKRLTTEGKGHLAIATIQNRFSHLRTLARWIGKEGLVKSVSCYPGIAYKRELTAKAPRTWVDKGVDSGKLIETIWQADTRVGDALALSRAFGLRPREAMLLKPHLADQGLALFVAYGTKGGRPRVVPITTPAQRALLERIKGYVGPQESLVPPQQRYSTFRRHYYRVVTRYGISRDDGITPHALRHEYLNELYEKTTGSPSAVRGGQLHRTNKALDSLGRQIVAEQAGHSREDIARAYLGGKR